MSETTDLKTDVVIEHKCLLAEGPVWVAHWDGWQVTG